MKRLFSIRRHRFYTLIVSLLAIFITYKMGNIRAIGYERIPTIGIFDERNYVLQGLSFRQYGLPIGWSDSGAYLKEHSKEAVQAVKLDGLTLAVNGEKPNFRNLSKIPKPLYVTKEFNFGLGSQQIRFVMPFIDHSPLGGLIMSLGISSHVRDFLDITPTEFRRASLTIAIITSILLFLYTLQLTKNSLISLMALAIYSTIPTYFFASRFALLENILAPLTLAHLNLLLFSHSLLEKKKRMSLLILIIAGIFGGLVVLAKESGAGFVVASILLTVIWKFPRKYILSFLMALGLVPLIYIFWGLWLAPKLFWEVISFNTGRTFFGSLNFLTSLPGLRFHDFPYDGWWIWGFISLFLMSLKESKKYLSFFLPFAGHLLMLLLLSNQNYPWYYLALTPFLAMASAWSLRQLLVAPTIPLATAFFLIPLSSSFYWGYTVFHLPPQIGVYRLIFIIFFFFLTARILKYQSKIVLGVWLFFLTVLFLQLFKWNVQSLYFIIDHWGNLPMPSLPTF